jgi:hypothetical protein
MKVVVMIPELTYCFLSAVKAASLPIIKIYTLYILDICLKKNCKNLSNASWFYIIINNKHYNAIFGRKEILIRNI